MPNWCSNTLVLEGDAKYIHKFCLENLNDEDIDFALCCPQPENITDWYEWCVREWGTKWNAGETSNLFFSSNGEKLSITFDTAWSPPIPWVKKVAIKYPDLTITLLYSEPGSDYSGEIICKYDVTLRNVSDIYGKYHISDEDNEYDSDNITYKSETSCSSELEPW